MFAVLFALATIGCVGMAFTELKKRTLRGFLLAVFDLALAGLFLYLITKV